MLRQTRFLDVMEGRFFRMEFKPGEHYNISHPLTTDLRSLTKDPLLFDVELSS